MAAADVKGRATNRGDDAGGRLAVSPVDGPFEVAEFGHRVAVTKRGHLAAKGTSFTSLHRRQDDRQSGVGYLGGGGVGGHPAKVVLDRNREVVSAFLDVDVGPGN